MFAQRYYEVRVRHPVARWSDVVSDPIFILQTCCKVINQVLTLLVTALSINSLLIASFLQDASRTRLSGRVVGWPDIIPCGEDEIASRFLVRDRGVVDHGQSID